MKWTHCSNDMKNVKQCHCLKGNVQNSQLYKVVKGGEKNAEKGNQIATYEDVFDILEKRDLKLTGDIKKKIWYGVKEKLITCPKCLKDSKPPKSESYGP